MLLRFFTMEFPVATLFHAGAILLFAYLIRGIAGFGSALIAVPLLALRLPLAAIVPLIALLDYLASLTHGLQNRAHIRWQEIVPLLPFTVLGVGAGLLLVHRGDPALLARALGIFVVTYAVYALLPLPDLKGPRWLAIPAGFCGGMVGALFGTGGPFYVIYLTLRQPDKIGFRATIATIFFLTAPVACSGLR